MSDPMVFTHRMTGGGCWALLVVMLVFPAMPITSYLAEYGGMLWLGGLVAIVAILATAIALWAFVRAEYRVELHADRVRFVEQTKWFGFPRPEAVTFDVRLDEASRVRMVNTRTPSRNGGWSHSSAIHFPGRKNVVPADFLGSREDPKSEYNRLVATLRERLGDRFSVEDKV